MRSEEETLHFIFYSANFRGKEKAGNKQIKSSSKFNIEEMRSNNFPSYKIVIERLLFLVIFFTACP